MDVDLSEVNTMTDKEKNDCLNKGLCFFCKQPGHLARTCPKKTRNRAPEGGPRRTPTRTPNRQMMVRKVETVEGEDDDATVVDPGDEETKELIR